MNTPSQTMTSKSIGDIDERGYLNGFDRRGFTPYKSKNELDANPLDAFDALDRSGLSSLLSRKKMIYSIDRKTTRFIDNAMGMNEEDAKNMASMHRENHCSDAARGVSGVGAKPSMSKLSNKKLVEVHTRKAGTITGYVIKYPWDKIHSEGRYTGQVTIRQMTSDEETRFHKEREENGMLNSRGEAHGTTTHFPTNDVLTDVIRRNFMPIVESEMNILDRTGVLFGREDVDIICKDYDQGTSQLQMYNYFGGNMSDYYQGISVETIEQWYSKETEEDRFLWRRDEEVYEITKNGRGYSKKAQLTTNNTIGYELVGKYTVKSGLRYDTGVFDPEKPVAITCEGVKTEYNGKHVNDDETFSISARLVRNGQIIGLIPIPKVTAAAAKRGTGESNFRHLVLQCEVLFNPVSKQKGELNHQDRVMNIQENKNQFDGSSLPITFTRLVKSIKVEKAKELWEYFNNIIAENEASKPKKVAEIKAEREAEETKRKKPMVAPPNDTDTDSTSETIDNELEQEQVEQEHVEQEQVEQEQVEQEHVEEEERVELEEVDAGLGEESNTVHEDNKKQEQKIQSSPVLVEEYYRGPIKGRDIINIVNSTIDPDEDCNGIPVEVYNLMCKYKKYKNN
jgi:hypothetical protein